MKKIEKSLESHDVIFTFFVGSAKENQEQFLDYFETNNLKLVREGKKQQPTREELKDNFRTNVNGAVWSKIHDEKRGCRIIIIYINTDNKTKKKLIQTTFHELRHAVDSLVDLRGLKFEDRENTALITGWLGSEFLCSILDYCEENGIE